MYIPNYTQGHASLNLQLIKEFPLGLLISVTRDEVQASPLPFFARVDKGVLSLFTHLAKSNPHWRSLQSAQALISFQGPQRYISPSLYVEPDNVPTWNYATVQCRGTAHLIQEFAEIEKLLQETITFFEARNGTTWKNELPRQAREPLMNAIVGLRIEVTEVQGKFKLSQNRSETDFAAVSNFLKNSQSEQDQQMFQWMQKSKRGE